MSEAKSRDETIPASRWRSRLVKLALVLLIVPLVFFALSNIWLSTGWGKTTVADKLKQRTGMDWQVQGMTWSPWGGLTIDGAIILQPEEIRDQLKQPLVKVNRVNVHPYWSELVRGKPSIRSVELDMPEIVVSVEMLAAMASRAPQEKVMPAKTVKPTPQSEKPKPKNQQPKVGKTKPPAPKPKAKPVAKKQQETPPKKQQTQPRPPIKPAIQVMMKNASLRVVSASKKIDLLEASAIDFDLSLFGEDNEGLLKLGILKVPGVEPLHDIEQEVVWRRPYLELKNHEIELGGVKLKGVAQLALLRNLPFVLDLAMDPQELEHMDVLDRLAIDMRAKQIAGRINASGLLVQPLSWRSSMLMVSEKLTVIEKHGGKQLHFDELSLPAVFRQGRLAWSSARAIGEDVAFLGNGTVSVAEGVTSVTRVVASPELAKFLHQLMIGVGLTGHRTWWENLETPDRKYRDVYVVGSLLDPRIDLGTKHKELSLWKTMSAVLHFVRVEMKEEGVVLEPIPNKDLLYKNQHANH